MKIRLPSKKLILTFLHGRVTNSEFKELVEIARYFPGTITFLTQKPDIGNEYQREARTKIWEKLIKRDFNVKGYTLESYLKLCLLNFEHFNPSVNASSDTRNILKHLETKPDQDQRLVSYRDLYKIFEKIKKAELIVSHIRNTISVYYPSPFNNLLLYNPSEISPVGGLIIDVKLNEQDDAVVFDSIKKLLDWSERTFSDKWLTIEAQEPHITRILKVYTKPNFCYHFYMIRRDLINYMRSYRKIHGEQMLSYVMGGLYHLNHALFANTQECIQFFFLLIKEGADVNQISLTTGHFRPTPPPLESACNLGDVDLVQTLLDHGARINYQRRLEFNDRSYMHTCNIPEWYQLRKSPNPKILGLLNNAITIESIPNEQPPSTSTDLQISPWKSVNRRC